MDIVNEELGILEKITESDVIHQAKKVLKEENSSVLYYDIKK